MSSKVGPLAYEKNEGPVFLGLQSGQRSRDYSDAKAQEIDAEIHRIIMEGYKKATDILTEKKDALERLTQALMEFETIDGREVDELIAGKSVEDLRKGREQRSASLKEENDKKSKGLKDEVSSQTPDDDKSGLGDPSPVGSPA